MKTLYLVGESAPIAAATGIHPPSCGQLTSLLPLDPRHGVFPNLVMTPLLATLSAFRMDDQGSAALWTQVDHLLNDASDRRFNAFDKLKGSRSRHDRFVIRADTVEKWSEFTRDQHLWLVFGYQTAFGLMRWAITGENEATRQDIEVFGKAFLRRASERWIAETGLPRVPPENKCAQEGYLHRLCTGEDSNGVGVRTMLRHAIETCPERRVEVSTVLGKARSIVPLLHNEAYQLAPYGIGQVCFLLCDAWGTANQQPPEEVYWRFIGKSIKRRLLSAEAAESMMLEPTCAARGKP